MALFPDAPLEVEPFAPFASENVQIGCKTNTKKKGTNFAFSTRSEPRKQCTVGMPHCPWFTKNRNNPWNPTEKKYNRGTRKNRPWIKNNAS